MDKKDAPSHSKALLLFSQCSYLFSHYKFLELLGQGGFSFVYLVSSDKYPDQKLAIKYIPSKLNNFSSKFNEILILTSLKYNDNSHSHIISVLETYIDPAECFTLIVMEKADKSLEDLLQEYRDLKGDAENRHSDTESRHFGLKADILLQIFYDILSGLQYAHSQKIVHGDLKPANILIFSIKDRKLLRNSQKDFVADSQQIAKIADWGSGKVAGDSINLTIQWETSLFLTQSFAAPETMKNEDLSLNLTKIDIYAFGLCMLRCCGVKEKEFKYWNLLPNKEKFSIELKGIIKKYRVRKIYGEKMEKLLKKMISFEHKKRIDVIEIYEILKEISEEKIKEFGCGHRVMIDSMNSLRKKFKKGFSKEKSDFIAKCEEKDCKYVMKGDELEGILGENQVFIDIYKKCPGCKSIKLKVFMRKLTKCEKRHRICYKCLKKSAKCPKRNCDKKIDKSDFIVICKKCEKDVKIEKMQELLCCERFYCRKCVKNMVKIQIKAKKSEILCEKCDNSFENMIIEEIIGKSAFDRFLRENRDEEKCEICDIFLLKKNFVELGCDHRICEICLRKYIAKNKEKPRIRCFFEECGSYFSLCLVKKYRDEISTNKLLEENKEKKTIEKTQKKSIIQKKPKIHQFCEKCLKSPENDNLSTIDLHCSHTFCRDCITMELMRRLSSNPDIGPEILRCLSLNCSFIIELFELQSFISEDLFKRLKTLKTIKLYKLNPNSEKTLEKSNKNCLICNKNLIYGEYIVLMCGHNYCKKCLVQKWEEKLYEPLIEPLKCPFISCQNPINFFKIKENLPENLFRIFEGRYFAKILDKKPNNLQKNKQKNPIKCPKCQKIIERNYIVKYLICDSQACDKKTVFCFKCRSILPVEVISLLNFPGIVCTKCFVEKGKKIKRNRQRKQENLLRKNNNEIAIIKPLFLKN